MTVRERLETLARKWRVTRDERARSARLMQDERAAAHLARQRAGIKDVHPGGAGG